MSYTLYKNAYFFSSETSNRFAANDRKVICEVNALESGNFLYIWGGGV